MATQKRPRILIVDDEEPFLSSICRTLRKEPYEIVTAQSGTEGLERLKEKKVDLVISDHMMPGMLGTDFLKLVREKHPGVWRIMLTGVAKYPDAINAVNEGEVYRIITKPVDWEQLRDAIRRTLKSKHTEDMLHRSERRLRNLIESNADALLVVDQEGVIRFINSAAEALFHRKHESMVGQPFGAALTSGESTEIDIRRSNEEPGVGEMRVVEMTWEGEPAFLVSIRDITERKMMEEELKESTATLQKTVKELKQANGKILEQQKSMIEEERLKVLLEMAGATAHELNQPLTALLGNIELMKLNRDEPDKLFKHADRVVEAGRRISEIVKKIHNIRHDETKIYLEGSNIINFDQKLKVLLIEDDEDYLRFLLRLLKKHPAIEPKHAATLHEARDFTKNGTFDLILLDHYLPDGESLDFLKWIHGRDVETPVVVCTGQGDETVASKVIQSGAYDYLPKTRVNEKSLFRSINNALEKDRLRKETKRAMEKLAEMSTKDELTGLYNRRYFMEALEKEVARAKRYNNDLMLCIMDLDHFKKVNDTYGHPTGDTVLSEIGRLLKKTVREVDVPCRYGGEEFAVILPNAGKEAQEKLGKRFLELVASQRFKHDTTEFGITISIGMASFRKGDTHSAGELTRQADQALYEAKAGGRNRVEIAP